MNIVDSVIDHCHAKSLLCYDRAVQRKASGFSSIVAGEGGGSAVARFTSSESDSRYAQFRGWTYSVVHAIALEGAGQPVQVGRLRGGSRERDEAGYGRSLQTKQMILQKMPASFRAKAALHEFEVVLDHPLVDLLEQPNPIQNRWEFTYSFIANLCLTGWAYVVGGETEDGYEFYSLPTTWVRPDKSTTKPFTRFFVGDPNSPNQKDHLVLTDKEVKLARIPTPGNPLGGLSPCVSQQRAVAIDDAIQSSQQAYFKNGIFPSVVITIGKDPHPEVPGGIRPRLSNAQRRQLIGSIKRTHASVENYGEPAIVDGMIESITRLSATANEMGWEVSEEKARLRLLSAFGVHPYILGEIANVGGYAQAAKIEERFCKRVNAFLEMASIVMTKFAAPLLAGEERLSIWWEQCQASDPGLRWNNLRYGRSQGDVSKNEFRAELGYPPDENDVGPRSKILDNPNGMMAILQLMSLVTNGQLAPEPAADLLALFLQISEEEAEEMIAQAVASGAQVPGVDQVPGEAPPTEDPIVSEDDEAE